MLMAIFRMKQIRGMSQKERMEKLRELQLELSKEKASGEIGGSVKNPGRIKEIRKTIARFKTVENEKR